MSGLTEFLLARIADDEGVVGNPRGPEHFGCVSPARVLAECEAKRRIVRGLSGGFAGPGFDGVAAAVLADLTLPYADHPDYREEWTP